MRIDERELLIPAPPAARCAIEHLRGILSEHLEPGAMPLRLAVTESDDSAWRCEIATLYPETDALPASIGSMLGFRRRPVEDVREFVTVLIVPTGIGAAIGGHSGDATPAARLLATLSDTLITHPNVVNGADLNEMPENALYVEGSIVTRLLMGTAGLQPVRSNRILLLVDDHEDALFVNAAINAANMARTAAGINVAEVQVIERRVRMSARYSASGRAVGEIAGLSYLRQVMDACRTRCDAIAMTSVMDVSREMNDRYFESDGSVINPYGGVEAMLTHALSGLFQIPVAHAPMETCREIANEDPGVLEPRMAAEGISWPMVYSVLKGLHRSPRIVSSPEAMRHPGVITSANVSCLVVPAGCLGLPTLAALDQGIPVIEVLGNTNLMRNDLSQLPWRPGQLMRASTYLEAAGLVAALRGGVDPESVTRGNGLGTRTSRAAQASFLESSEALRGSADEQARAGE